MYYELVKRLREHNGWALNETLDEAADAIEELSKALESVIDVHNEGYDVGYWAGRRDYEQKWIPVTERLPENKVPVQVVYLSVNDGKQYSDLIAYVFEGMWCYWDGEPCSYDECKCEITHWMPLPEPPKEAEE